MTVSGNTTRSAPWRASAAMAAQTLCVVASRPSRQGESWTAAATTFREALITPARLHGPSVQNESVTLAMQQNQIEHVERIDRPNSLDQTGLAVPVQGLQCEAARIGLASLHHELLQGIVHGEVTWERFVAELRKPALHA